MRGAARRGAPRLLVGVAVTLGVSGCAFLPGLLGGGRSDPAAVTRPSPRDVARATEVQRPRATESRFEWGPSPTIPLSGNVTYHSLLNRVLGVVDPLSLDVRATMSGIPAGVIDGPESGLKGLYEYGPFFVDAPTTGRTGRELFQAPYLRAVNGLQDPFFGQAYAADGHTFPLFVGIRLSRWWSTERSPFSVTGR